MFVNEIRLKNERRIIDEISYRIKLSFAVLSESLTYFHALDIKLDIRLYFFSIDPLQGFQLLSLVIFIYLL